MESVTDHDDIRSMPINNATSERIWKDTIVRQCICGCDQFWVLTKFEDDGEIAGYFTDALCAMCNAWVKVPTPIDKEIP